VGQFPHGSSIMHYSSLARINHAYSLLEKHIPITTLSVFQDTSRQQFISIGEDWIACMHEHSPNYIATICNEGSSA